MLKASRSVLLVLSTLMVLLLVGGGLLGNVGAAESSSRQAVLFSEVLSLVIENYVDPVDADRLLQGAYEGMLGALDSNGAFLTPSEVTQWKAGKAAGDVDPGISVLKAGRSVQVVAVDPGSSAAEAGIAPGDQIRAINEVLTRDLSLEQVRRMLRGESGTSVRLDVMHAVDGFRREELELLRLPRRGPAFELAVQRGIGVLRIRDLSRLERDRLDSALGDIASRGIDQLLLDLRNVAEGTPRELTTLAQLLGIRGGLRLRDRSGRLVESLDFSGKRPAWKGALSILVNSATAGGSEALALLGAAQSELQLYGESTYGLGAEASLYEMESGAGLLVSSSLWESRDGGGWNDDGVKPDEEVSGDGETLEEVEVSQLEQVLDRLGDSKEDDQSLRPAA